MLIDWFTVVAQTINFLILVWLMKRFLYRPILTAIDTREAHIAAQLKQAEINKTEATRERDDYQQKSALFDQQRDVLLSTAINDAGTEKQKLLEQAQRDAELLRAKLTAAVQNERDMLGREVMTHVQNEVFAIARKTLADLAAVSIETRIGEVFIDRLRSLAEPEKAQFSTGMKNSPVLIRSALTLPAPQREQIQQALNEIFGAQMPAIFESAPSLISGIELSANGQKIAWSIDDYLNALNAQVDVLLAPSAAVVPNPDLPVAAAIAPAPTVGVGNAV